jgi:hypothetical protein
MKQAIVIAFVMMLGVAPQTQVSAVTPAAHAKTTTAAQKEAKPKIKYYRINANQTLHFRLDQTLKSETARVGDTFTATLVDPVYSSNGVELIPAGSSVSGRVNAVQRARKNGTPATMDVGFYRVRLPNGRSSALNGSLTDLNASGSSSNNEGTVSAKKTSHRNAKFIGGGAAGGALIGAIAGGGKGAAIGAGVGAGGGFIAKKLRKGHEVEVKEGTEFGVILNQSIALPAYKPS